MSAGHALDESVLVFDVGGTHLRAARYVPRDDAVLDARREPTPSLRTMDGATPAAIRRALYGRMDDLARSLYPERLPRRAAVGFAGPLDAEGRVMAAPTVWGRVEAGESIDVRGDLSLFWPGTTVRLINDVTAAGYRSLCRPDEDLCVVTVSSGIGHKVFVGGRPVVGPGGRGGELGHLRVDFSDDAARCECGGRGHLGAVASGSATGDQVARLAVADLDRFAASLPGRRTGGRPELVDNRLLAEAFRAGDPWAERVVERMAHPLAWALAALHLAVGTERFVIVGGFALALGTRYREALARLAARCSWDVGADWDRMVELGADDDDAGLIGAGRFAVGP